MRRNELREKRKVLFTENRGREDLDRVTYLISFCTASDDRFRIISCFFGVFLAQRFFGDWIAAEQGFIYHVNYYI